MIGQADTPSEPAAAKIELKTSDLFHQHKRNLMFTSSVTLVLGLAVPGERVKLPGITDVGLPMWLAFSSLISAIIYFAMQYRTEYVVVRARNAKSIAHSNDHELDQAFARLARHVQEMDEHIWTSLRKLQEQVDEASRILGNLRGLASDELTRALRDMLAKYESAAAGRAANNRNQSSSLLGKAVTTALEDRAPIWKQLSEDIHPLRGMMEETVRFGDNLHMEMAEARSDMADLRSQFDVLSLSIYQSQRRGFVFLDGWIPVILATAAIIVAAGYISGWLPISVPHK